MNTTIYSTTEETRHWMSVVGEDCSSLSASLDLQTN